MLRTYKILLVSFLLSLSATTQGAPVFWSPEAGGNGHYYALVTFVTPTNWTDANADAQSRTYLGVQGHLVTITSAAEDAFLKSQFYGSIGDPGTGIPGVYAWIGLTDYQQEGVYRWVTGEPFTYANWAPPEPNNLGDEDYVYLWVRKYSGTNIDPNGTPTWSWNDAGNFPLAPGLAGSIVEFDAPFSTSVPEPYSAILVGAGLITLAISQRKNRKAKDQ